MTKRFTVASELTKKSDRDRQLQVEQRPGLTHVRVNFLVPGIRLLPPRH